MCILELLPQIPKQGKNTQTSFSLCRTIAIVLTQHAIGMRCTFACDFATARDWLPESDTNTKAVCGV